MEEDVRRATAYFSYLPFLLREWDFPLNFNFHPGKKSQEAAPQPELHSELLPDTLPARYGPSEAAALFSRPTSVHHNWAC